MDIKHLHREGNSIKAITRLTGHSRNTVRRVLRQPKPTPFQTPPRHSRLDEFKPYLEKRYQECALSSVRLLAEIRALGYQGSAATLYRFTQTLRAAATDAEQTHRPLRNAAWGTSPGRLDLLRSLC